MSQMMTRVKQSCEALDSKSERRMVVVRMKTTCKDCRRQTTQENKTEDSVIMSVVEDT